MRYRLLILGCLSAIYARGQSLDPRLELSREIMAVRISKPLKLDAVLDEALYQNPPLQAFVQIDPDNGRLPSEKTDVWIGYDDDALYIGANLWDSRPETISGRLVRRDTEFQSDEFQVAIDSYNDDRSGFYFVVNPSGSIGDGTISNDSDFDDTWDGIWDSHTAIYADRWTVEMRIPFSQLRFNAQDEYVMGIGFGRILYRKNEYSLTFYIARGASGTVSHFADLTGISTIQPPRRLDLLPYVTTGYSSLPSEADNPFSRGTARDSDLGMDLKLGIGSNLTVDVTLNPDFGQVEVDPSTINLSAYETFYREKRPFFVEGAGIFQFGTGGPTNRSSFGFYEPDFFYSRRIGRQPQNWPDSDGWIDMPAATTILGASKISGKLPGNWSVGGLTALTRREYVQVDEDTLRWQEEAEPLTSFNLLRIQKEFNGGRQGLGFLTTYVRRDFQEQALTALFNHQAAGGGVDGWTFLNHTRDWVVAGWAGFTQVAGTRARLWDLQQNSSHYFQRPDAGYIAVDSTRTRLTGAAGRITLNKEQGHINFNTSLGIVSPGFDSNDLGLTFGTDRINKHILVGYKWYDPGQIFRFLSINTAYMNNHNFGGIKISERLFLFCFAQFLNYSRFEFFAGWGPRTFDDVALRGGPLVESPSGIFARGEIGTDERRSVVLELSGDASHNTAGDLAWEFDPGIEFKLGQRLNLSLEPEYSREFHSAQYIEQYEDARAEAMYGRRYVVAELHQETFALEMRVNYTFTPTLTLQAYLQPFLAAGDYSRFKEFRRPRSYDFLVYGQEGSQIDYLEEYGLYKIDPSGDLHGDQDAFYVENPDFNYQALVGNAVLRWEFRPGSTLYLVWTRNGELDSTSRDLHPARDLRRLFGTSTDNIFAVKFSYWFGI